MCWVFSTVALIHDNLDSRLIRNSSICDDLSWHIFTSIKRIRRPKSVHLIHGIPSVAIKGARMYIKRANGWKQNIYFQFADDDPALELFGNLVVISHLAVDNCFVCITLSPLHCHSCHRNLMKIDNHEENQIKNSQVQGPRQKIRRLQYQTLHLNRRHGLQHSVQLLHNKEHRFVNFAPTGISSERRNAHVYLKNILHYMTYAECRLLTALWKSFWYFSRFRLNFAACNAIISSIYDIYGLIGKRFEYEINGTS